MLGNPADLYSPPSQLWAFCSFACVHYLQNFEFRQVLLLYYIIYEAGKAIRKNSLLLPAPCLCNNISQWNLFNLMELNWLKETVQLFKIPFHRVLSRFIIMHYLFFSNAPLYNSKKTLVFLLKYYNEIKYFLTEEKLIRHPANRIYLWVIFF